MDASPASLLDPPAPIHAFTAASLGDGLNRARAAIVADAAAAGTLEPTMYPIPPRLVHASCSAEVTRRRQGRVWSNRSFTPRSTTSSSSRGDVKRPEMDSLTAGRLSADMIETAWRGAMTSQETPELRERLFDLLDAPGGTSLRVDVRDVTSIDRSGIGVLIGANHRAAATGRTFVLIDSGGPVSQALRRMHLLGSFLVTQVVPADHDLAGLARLPAGG